ncbi:MAG: hypothetical protein JW904_05800 [Spirochaetales bacterium]|nr:hypothetical protein [Spirochaetales bacterium]
MAESDWESESNNSDSSGSNDSSDNSSDRTPAIDLVEYGAPRDGFNFPYAPGTGKPLSFELVVSAPLLFSTDGFRYGFTLDASFVGFFIFSKLYLHQMFDTNGVGHSFYTVNLGIAIPAGNLLLAFYGGMSGETINYGLGLSFGTQARIFITENIMLSLDANCSTDGNVFHVVATPAIGYILDHFVFSAGFEYAHFTDLDLYGGTVKISLWF